MSAAAAARRGALIVFEGVDRCGKTTQATRLTQSLKDSGVPAEFMRFPGARTECTDTFTLWRCGACVWVPVFVGSANLRGGK